MEIRSQYSNVVQKVCNVWNWLQFAKSIEYIIHPAYMNKIILILSITRLDELNSFYAVIV